MKDETEREIEIRKLQEIAKMSSIYYKSLKNFERNRNLSHVVHAALNFSQFVCVLLIEIFHLVHHAINENMRMKDPTVPELPEGKNPIFFTYPICMTISLVLAILWLTLRTFGPLIEMSLAGCFVGILSMLAAGILEMRHAEIYINLEVVPDSALMQHPIFMHNFFMCILSVLAMVIYFIHFWILWEYYFWRKRMREAENTSSNSESDKNSERISMGEPSKKSQLDISNFLDGTTTWETLKTKLLDFNETDLDREPVILYCCCADFWYYFKDRDNRIPIHEFQVVHIK